MAVGPAMNARERFDRVERATDLPLALLALLIVPALILEDSAASAAVRQIAHGLNWFVWLAFVAEYVGKLLIAPSRRSYVRGAWFDLLIIALSPPFLVPVHHGVAPEQATCHRLQDAARRNAAAQVREDDCVGDVECAAD